MLIGACADLGLDVNTALEDPRFAEVLQEVLDTKEVAAKHQSLGLAADGSLLGGAASSIGLGEEDALKKKILKEQQDEAKAKKASK